MRAWWWGALLHFALCGCAATAAPAGEGGGPTGIHYTFTVPESLAHIHARVCFEGPAPSELICGVRWGREYLRAARSGSGQALPVREQRVQLDGVGRDACIEYEVALQDVADTYGALYAERRGDALMSNLALWLWRPPAWRSTREVTAAFELPEGMAVSVPWAQRADGRYRLDETAFAYLAYAMFGRFDVERIRVPGAEVEVARLDGLSPELGASVRPWIETAARMVAQPLGRFPRERAQVIVIPSNPREQPVGFGTVSRGGGASIGVFLPRNSDLTRMQRDWVAVHEFSHLYHPFVERGDAWLSEGMATYYQEVLRARAGLQTPERAWQRLWEGAARGRAADHTLERESEEMFFNFSFPMVYWAGAAFALMADVELRKRGGDAASLDAVMAELAECCSAASRPWSARRVVARMDRIAGEPVFERLVARWVRGPRLPDLGPLYEELGVVVDEHGAVQLRPAPAAALRDAIMRVDPELAGRVQRLGRL